jgi:hypothetical protein
MAALRVPFFRLSIGVMARSGAAIPGTDFARRPEAKVTESRMKA